MRIELNLDNDLCVIDKKLQVKISPSEGNALQIKDDGIYAESTSGHDGSQGSGYPKQDGYGIRIGYTNIFNPDTTISENGTLVHLTNTVHRFYKLNTPYVEGDKTIDSSNYRLGNCDIILVGDMMYFDDTENSTRDVWLITKVKYSDAVMTNNIVNEDMLHDTEIVTAVKILEGVVI